MAITLRNKTVEEQIREIGKATGEGPSAVIARVVKAEGERLREEKERRTQERLARMRAFRATLPTFTDEEKKAVWDALDDLYGEDGLPK